MVTSRDPFKIFGPQIISVTAEATVLKCCTKVLALGR